MRFSSLIVELIRARPRLVMWLAVLAQAALWLLDEPTTNLDADGQQLVSDLVAEQLARNGVVVAAIHHVLPVGESSVITLELPSS